MLIVALVALVNMILLFAPESDAGRVLNRALVEPLLRIRRGQALLVAAAITFCTAAWAVFGTDAIRLLAASAPDLIAWIAAADMALLAEVAAGALLARTSLRLRAVADAARIVAIRVRRAIPRVRARRARDRSAAVRGRTYRSPANDADAEPPLALAA